MSEIDTSNVMAQKILQLEKAVLEYIRKEEEFNRKQKVVEYGYMKRTISLIKIIEELNREVSILKHDHKEKMRLVESNLKKRTHELNSLYDISSLKVEINFSLEHVLQAVVDYIPPAIQYPEIACARILFDGYHFKTKNYVDTKWKLSQDIIVNNELIGELEVCYLKNPSEPEKELFNQETINFIISVAETIAQIVEREWAEIEIRKGRIRIEKLIKSQTS